MQERENLIDLLKRTRKALLRKDVFVLNKLSNRTIHSSSIYNDADNIAIAVIVYSLGKVVEREKYAGYKEWPQFFRICLKGIDDSIIAVQNNDQEALQEAVKSMRKAIEELSGHLKDYIEEVFRRASINKASRVYEHGISMQQTASLLGITIFELAEYVGKTGISDVDLSVTKPEKSRLEYVEDLFK